MYFKLHLGDLNRNEKCLAAMASGKWLLRKSFLDASKEAGRFVSVYVLFITDLFNFMICVYISEIGNRRVVAKKRL